MSKPDWTAEAEQARRELNKSKRLIDIGTTSQKPSTWRRNKGAGSYKDTGTHKPR